MTTKIALFQFLFLLPTVLVMHLLPSAFACGEAPLPQTDECDDFRYKDVLVRGILLWKQYPDGTRYTNEPSLFWGGGVNINDWGRGVDGKIIAKVKISHVYFPKLGRLMPGVMIRVSYPPPNGMDTSFVMNVGEEYALRMRRNAQLKLYEVDSDAETHFPSMSLELKQIWERCGNRSIQSLTVGENNLDDFEYDFTMDELFYKLWGSKFTLSLTAIVFIGWKSGFFRRFYRNKRKFKPIELKDAMNTGDAVFEVV
jgi:hypothetical protein